MKRYFRFLLPISAVFVLTSCAAQPRFPGRNERNVYENRDDDYNNDRYGNDRYGNNRYGNNWMELGSRRLSDRDNYEKINVKGRYDNFRQLRFETDGAVNIYRAVVRYDNGRTEELRIPNNRRDRARANSVMVNLPSYRSGISKVMFWYETDGYYRNNRGMRNRSIVSVYGR